MGFKERLKQARKNMGLTQEQLGDLIGVAKSTITGYEKGNSEPDMAKTNKLIEVLGIDANYLFQDSIDMLAVNSSSSVQVGTDQVAATGTATELTQEEKEKQLAAMLGDELWGKICNDEKKYALMQWISSLNEEQLDRVEKLLDAALLLPKE